MLLLIWPIPVKCVLYVVSNELIEGTMLVFQLTFQWCHSLESVIKLCHAGELHHDVPFWHVSDAAKTHLAARDAIALHASFADQMIKEAAHVGYPISVADFTCLVGPHVIDVHVTSKCC